MATNDDTTLADEEEKKAISSPVECKVLLLDGSDYIVTISKKALGQVLVDLVCEHISLAEKDYFSCSYMYHNNRFWINPDREISKAGKKSQLDVQL